ncbi:MAG: hypothetical protein ACLRT5_02590 [Lachnospiraceae bacterium]
MKRRWIACLCAAAMVMGMTACGGGEDGAKESANTTATDDGSSEEAESDSAEDTGIPPLTGMC